jgi:hypothetical protein
VWIAGALAFDPEAGPVSQSTVARLNELQRRRDPMASGFGHQRTNVLFWGTGGLPSSISALQVLTDVGCDRSLGDQLQWRNLQSLRAQIRT